MADFIFKNQKDLILLAIDEGKCRHEIKYEGPSWNTFPYIYGELNIDAVIRVCPHLPKLLRANSSFDLSVVRRQNSATISSPLAFNSKLLLVLATSMQMRTHPKTFDFNKTSKGFQLSQDALDLVVNTLAGHKDVPMKGYLCLRYKLLPMCPGWPQKTW